MTFGELKDEIFALNWESGGSYDGDRKLICFAVNRAIGIISSEVRPILGELLIKQAGAGRGGRDGYIRYRLRELTKYGEISRFRAVADVYFDSGETLVGYKLEGISVLCVPCTYKGDIRVVYSMAYTPVTVTTQDSFAIELDEEVCVLVPLLAAYFVWLDDDRSRAQEYYNQYEARRDRLVLKRGGHAASIVISPEYMGI